MKIKQRTKKTRHTGKIIALIVISIIVAAGIYYYYQEKEREDRQWKWVTSGPFSINKNQYKLGENIFMVVSDLKPEDIGEFDVVTPKGNVFTTVQFNGSMKSSFHYYFKPDTERKLALCNPTDLVGHWFIAFKGVKYKSIPFDIINDWISGAQSELQPVPKGLDPC